MATILEFRAQSFRSPLSASRQAGAGAEIVLFPGVRYERWVEEPLPTAQSKPKRGRKRDRLELED